MSISVLLRPLERRHLEKTLEWANDPELMRLLNRAHTISREEHEQWFAGIRDWEHGWLKVLKKSGDHLKQVLSEDLGAEVDVYTPEASESISI